MDLVGDDQHVVGAAGLGEARQLAAAPDAADGVVRAGQDEHLRLRVAGFRGKIVEVHAVMAVFVAERIFHDLNVVVIQYHAERIIYGRLDDGFFARADEGARQHRQRGDNARSGDDPFGLYLPAVARLHPVCHGAAVSRGPFGVAVDAVFDAGG